MAKFKSYASPTGFKPIQVPDETGKYLQQGQSYMRAMQRAMDFDIQNRNRYAQAMANAQQMEASNRDMIFKLDQDSRQRVQNQIQGNYQQTIRDADLQGRQELQTLQTLASFSNTAFEAVNTFYQKREEGIKLGVHQAIYATGLDLKGLQELYKLDRNLTDQSLAENQFIKGLLDKGSSIQDIRYLMKHSNAKYWNENKSLAQDIGSGFGNYSNDNYETKYKVGDQEVSMAEALQTGQFEAIEVILGQQRAEYWRESGALQMSPQVAAAYIHPQMQAYENQIRQSANSLYRKTTNAEVNSNLVRSMSDKLSTEGPQAVLDSIAAAPTGAMRSAQKSLALQTLAMMSQGDDWKQGQEVLEQFLNGRIVRPDGTETTFGEFNKNDPAVLEVINAYKDARKRDLQDYNLTRQEEATRFQITEIEFAKILREQPGGFTQADVEAAQLQLRKMFRDMPGTSSQVLETLARNESTNALYEKNIVEQLDRLKDAGLLTEERLDNMGVPGSIAAKYRADARRISSDRASNNQFKPQLESLSILAQSPPQVAAKVVGGKYHWTVPLMEQRLHNEFLTKYAELSAAGDPNAAEAARSFVTAKFNAQTDNPKFFNNEGGYVQFTSTKSPSTAATARMSWVQGRIGELGVKALDSNGAVFTISELNTIEQNAAKPGFKMDPMAEYVGRLMGVDPFTVINRQRAAAGLPLMQLPESTTRFSTQANPELLRKLQSYGTPEISTRTMASTGTFDVSRVPGGYGQMVETASKASNVAPNYIAALAEIESTWDPNATSPTGAIGLMQIQQQWHPSYQGGKDPQANLTYGAQYYGQLLRKYGDPVLAAGAYNAGPGRFDEYLNSGRPLPQETVDHMRKFSKALAKYGDLSQLQSRHTMRTSMQSYGRGSFERPSSVVFEAASGQPGVDLYFESKRFPAVLGGVVKDVSRESGYGNYVVVESIDPMTGQKVDVLYGHLADGLGISPGQRVEAGDIIGTQGGTGNVRSVDGTIASIDFLAPAPRGSKSMTPYAGFDNLRRFVVTQLQR